MSEAIERGMRRQLRLCSEAIQRGATRKNIAHMNVNSTKASAVKGRGHFYLTVNALLTQNSNARTITRSN